MGMDLYISLYKRTNNKLDDYSNLQYVEELCYARKFWGLWYELAYCPSVDPNDECKVILTLEAWDALMDRISPMYATILQAIDIYDEYDYEIIDSDSFPEELDEVLESYENWYDDIFPQPRLGYDFDARILARWYEARDTVREYLNNKEYVVLVINSF